MNTRSIWITSLVGAALVLPGLHCGRSQSNQSSMGQTGGTAPFTVTTVASGLAQPAGIAFTGANTVTVSQQPTAPQDASMARINLATGAVTLFGTGTAASGFAAGNDGTVYWVDPAKGALMAQGGPGGAPAALHTGGPLPETVLAVDPANRVYLGGAASSAGGSAKVAVLAPGSSPVGIPDPPGPEKTAMAAASTGDLYWTSSKAGVIFHVAPDGTGNVVASGLNAPHGIALDPAGDILYFTEVPTPGVSGGRNTVNALDLASMSRTVVDRGDPQPEGVAVAPDGNVFWTSTSRGLVLRAVPSAAVAAPQFTATLTGAAEVPPVTTQASGQATFAITAGTHSSEDDDRVGTSPSLRYQVSITGITSLLRLEIHQGAAGSNGPLVATLSRGDDFGEGDDGGGSGGFSAMGRIRLRDLRGPFANNWTGFSAALSAGALYLNALTQAHPAGEIRGKIMPAGAPPANRPPVGTITAPAANVTIQAGASVSFSGTATDPDGDAVTVLWDFGDGTTSALPTPGSHAYPAAGTFTVRFTATDSHGLSDPNPPTRVITVQPAVGNQPPNATITAPAANVSITAGQSVSFAGTATDPDGDTVTVLWDFGDGSTSTLLSPGAHTYAAAGTFTVTLTATDSAGMVDPTPATRTITVAAVSANLPPTATITAPAGNVTIAAGQSVSFAGTATDPNAGDTVTVVWNFGDGTTSTVLSPGAHTYPTAGTFTVTLTATDNHGLAATTPPTRTITVTPVSTAPTFTQLKTTIFTPLCTSCHSGPGSPANLDLSAGAAYANLVNVPAVDLPGLRVVPGNPGASALVTQLANGHRSVSAANQALISAWITAGALNN